MIHSPVQTRGSTLSVHWGVQPTFSWFRLSLLLKDNPAFNEIGVGAPSRRNVSIGCTVRITLGGLPKTAPFLVSIKNTKNMHLRRFRPNKKKTKIVKKEGSANQKVYCTPVSHWPSKPPEFSETETIQSWVGSFSSCSSNLHPETNNIF